MGIFLKKTNQMKNLLLNSAALFLVIFGLNQSLQAQKSVTDIAELSDKKWDKFLSSDVPAFYYLQGLVNTGLLDAENAPQPKRIGILTFQLYSLGSSSSSKAGDWVYTRTYYSTEGGEAFLTDQIMGMIVPEMKRSFTDAGYELLTPSEYLDTPAKREAYETGASTIEASGLTKFAWGSLESGSDDGYEGVVPEGYQFYPISPKALSGDIKGPAGYGLLAEKLGLDGLLIISMTTVTSRKYITLDNFSAAVVGPINDNKEAEYKGRIGAGNMNRARNGLVYSYAGFDVSEIPLLKLKKEEFVEYYYEKFDVIAGRMGKKLTENLDELRAFEAKGSKK